MPVEEVMSVFGHLRTPRTAYKRLKGGNYEIQVKPEIAPHIEGLGSKPGGVFELKKENGDTLIIHTGRKKENDLPKDPMEIAKFHRDGNGNFFVTLLGLKHHHERQIQLANHLHVLVYPLDEHIRELKAAFNEISDTSRKTPFAASGGVEKILDPLLVGEFGEFTKNGNSIFHFQHYITNGGKGRTTFVFHEKPTQGKPAPLLAVIINKETLMLLSRGEKDYKTSLTLAKYLQGFKNLAQTRRAFEELGETRIKNGKLVTWLNSAVVQNINDKHKNEKSAFTLGHNGNSISILHTENLAGNKKIVTEIGRIKYGVFSADVAGNHEKLIEFSKYLHALATR
ncbi:hypothetical protein HY993_03195 [Candidatus Micrarchaeota archaeon]|nr:hypothetical protein [Candidatus Micrarchaeota archaeon]